MSESEQDALLNKIEARRRWRVIGSRALGAIFASAPWRSHRPLRHLLDQPQREPLHGNSQPDLAAVFDAHVAAEFTTPTWKPP